MSSVSRYADTHTLYVLSGAARNEDLKNVVLSALRDLERKTRTKYPCKVTANLIYDREGTPYGFGYLHVSNSEVYHMLLGRNPDGSKREEIIDKSIEIYWPDPSKPIEWFDWADAAEAIEIVPLPSLLPLPSFPYTRHQKLLFAKMVHNIRTSEKQHLDPEQFDPNVCTFQLGAGLVKPVHENRSPHILCARDIPEWLDAGDVYRKFRPFVTNGSKRIKKRGKQGSVEIQYPQVTVNRKNKLCFVEFDELTRDAQFALIMTTKIDFKSKTSSPTRRPLEKTLIFTHAFKSNKRDTSKRANARARHNYSPKRTVNPRKRMNPSRV